MKTKLLLVLCLLFCKLVPAQINLVNNPSFEDTVFCPIGLDNMPDVQTWSSYGNSADYFNGCSTTGMNVPNATFGYQLAHSGQAYCGVVTYLKGTSPLGNNHREFIGIQLSSPLQIGTRYYFSFYAVSAENNAIGFFSNNIGLRFFTNPYSYNNSAPVDNFAHIKLDTILKDTVYWHKVNGSFIADSNYQFVSIGNFYDFLNTDTLTYTSFPQCAYSYIDDVCVTTDSIYNEIWTGLQNKEINSIKFDIYPNPAKDKLHIESKSNFSELEIFDLQGKLLSRLYNLNLNDYSVDVSNLTNSIYFIKLENKDSYSFQKFIINR